MWGISRVWFIQLVQHTTVWGSLKSFVALIRVSSLIIYMRVVIVQMLCFFKGDDVKTFLFVIHFDQEVYEEAVLQDHALYQQLPNLHL